MKVWIISVLLFLIICLTIPFVTAEEKGGIDLGGKIRTPAKVEIREDPLIGLKKLIGIESVSNVEIFINSKLMATIPDNSPVLSRTITEECLVYQYGTLNWYNCEGEI